MSPQPPLSTHQEDKLMMRDTAIPPPPPPPPPPSFHREVATSIPNIAISPPPSPPSQPQLQTSSLESEVPPPPAMPPGACDPIDKAHYFQFLKDTHANMPGEPFHPFLMFFYGSLMDPEVVQAILNLADLPTMRPATITGFRLKMWGIYPTLIPTPDHSGSVSGTAWEVASEKQSDRLAAYETDAYRWDECEIFVDDGDVVWGRTFCWAGDPGSKELEEGSFDLERYQKYFKASVTRRREPVP